MTWTIGVAHDVAVDVDGLAETPLTAKRADGRHRPVLPDVGARVRTVRRDDNLSVVVDGARLGGRMTTRSAEHRQRAVVPQHSLLKVTVAVQHEADDLTGGVDAER